MGDDDRIKSALELALERTQGMKASSEEIEALREKEIKGRLKGVVSRFIDNVIPVKALEKELAEADEAERSLVRTTMLEELFAFIQPGIDCTVALEGLEAVAGSAGTEHLETFRALLRAFEAERFEAQRNHRLKALDVLKGRGVQGSALVPNLRDDKEWQRTSERIKTACLEEMEKARVSFMASVA